MNTLRLEAHTESWPLAGSFTISRGTKTTAEVVVLEISDGAHSGRAECVPYARYGESMDGVLAQLADLNGKLAGDVSPADAQSALPAGAARNALDCALWDLTAKRFGQRVWTLAEEPVPEPVTTAYTLSLDTPENMGAAARASAHRPLIKLKLAGDGDLERVSAVRENAPDATLIVDANEGWRVDQVEHMAAALARLGVAMVEQPLRVGEDDILGELSHPLPFCADESCHTREGLERLAGRYEFINIKLDKAGGLTESLALRDAGLAAGFRVMVGCMMGTSLGMAPAFLIAQGAEFVDLDGPLWMAQDRKPGLRYDGSIVSAPDAALWG
jgi:L-alanine-DL-glutamate epimerase-like enolase superfamily enzyme